MQPIPHATEKHLLLHTCCAPCASGCVEPLQNADRIVTLFFSNSNLCSFAEYEKRLDSVRILADFYHMDLLIDPYDHEAWLTRVSTVPNYQSAPERGPRCAACFEYSFYRAAQKAQKLGMNFATTLTVSPHKNSKVLFAIGEQYPHFEAWDFKKKDGFLKSLKNSAALGLYRQSFCGCEFSFRLMSDIQRD